MPPRPLPGPFLPANDPRPLSASPSHHLNPFPAKCRHPSSRTPVPQPSTINQRHPIPDSTITEKNSPPGTNAPLSAQCVTPIRNAGKRGPREGTWRSANRRGSGTRRDAGPKAKRAAHEAANPPPATALCPICEDPLPPVLTGRQVTCGRYWCRQERRRQMTRARVARFRARRRARPADRDRAH